MGTLESERRAGEVSSEGMEEGHEGESVVVDLLASPVLECSLTLAHTCLVALFVEGTGIKRATPVRQSSQRDNGARVLEQTRARDVTHLDTDGPVGEDVHKDLGTFVRLSLAPEDIVRGLELLGAELDALLGPDTVLAPVLEGRPTGGAAGADWNDTLLGGARPMRLGRELDASRLEQGGRRRRGRGERGAKGSWEERHGPGGRRGRSEGRIWRCECSNGLFRSLK